MPDDQSQAPLTAKRVLDFVRQTRPEDIPETAQRAAALALIDTLGVLIAAHPMEAGQIAREAALRLYGATTAKDQAPLLLDGRLCSRAGSAFAAATQIDNLDAHDGYNPTLGHIGVAAVPTLFAVAHGRSNLTGPQALAALVIAYEVAGRAGIALHSSVSDYHTSGAWNALGVAAMTARLVGLGAEPLRQALGIAEYHGPRSQMMREIANPTMLHDGSGMGALVGISAATLAEMGFTGAPALTVEDPALAAHWADLGQFWQVEHQYVKPYPVCRWAHAAIDAVRELRSEYGFAAEEIASIDIRTFRNAVELVSGMPHTTSEAQYALQFPVAVMAVHEEIGLSHISGDGLSDPVVGKLVARTRAVVADKHETRFPTGRWADVTIGLKDGRTLDSGDTHARGGPERPFSESDVIAKFRAFAEPVVGTIRAEEILTAALGLTSTNSTFAQLSELLVEAPEMQPTPQA